VTIDYKVLFRPFDGDNCKALVGKPKMFFIQACRGDLTEEGRQVVTDYCARYEAAQSGPDVAVESGIVEHIYCNDDQSILKPQTDQLVCFATSPSE
jgi:hypothetical protein